MTVSLFGIGDCGECSAKLGVELIQSGFGNLAFVGVKFLDIKEGMETSHSLIVANLLTLSLPPNNIVLSIYDFFKALSPTCLVGDAFLGLTFPPTNIPNEFIRYIDAYGGRTEIIQCQHFYNVPRKSLTFGGYLKIAETIVNELKLKQPLLEEDCYRLEGKIKIEDTILVTLLKEKSKLSFFGVRDKEYKVDAIVELNTKENRSIAANLQRSLKGHGRFFDIKDKKEVFVLEGINLSDENPKLIQNIQNMSPKK